MSQPTSIRPIDAASVHRICSGQVVLDLASAVKELVENALDAGATLVEVRLKEHGSELVEVSDNGCGVSAANYQALTTKYHTSKMAKFSDLTSLTSFGFRGEALSSLCALCDLSVVTRTREQEAGMRIEYDREGRIASTASAARAVGTTVALKDLFKMLPVRHKDFLRNLKREFGKLLSLMQAYALICVGVRLVVTHTAGRAPRATVVHTQGGATLRDNIVTVLGAASCNAMQPFNATLPGGCTVTGFVSSPTAGCGRSAGDRQFLYVNGRPVDLPRVAKALNEVYKSFNASQLPAAVLDIKLPTDAYDVNVTPDKRRVMLHAEDALLSALREALTAAYEPSRGTYAVGAAEAAFGGAAKRGGKAKRGGVRAAADAEGDWVSGADETDSDAEADAASDSEGSQSADPARRGKAKRLRGSGSGAGEAEQPLQRDADAAPAAQGEHAAGRGDSLPTPPAASAERLAQAQPGRPSAEHSRQRASALRVPAAQQTCMKRFVTTTPSQQLQRDAGGGADDGAADMAAAADAADAALAAAPPPPRTHGMAVPVDAVDAAAAGAEVPALMDEGSQLQLTSDDLFEERARTTTAGPGGALARQEQVLPFDLATVRAARAARRRALQAASSAAPRTSFVAASLQAGAGGPADVTPADTEVAATAELERSFKRSDFAALRVAGQFNLGFILAVLGDDLFIVDQHASDEIYNFERLKRTTCLNKQPLIAPQPLQLTAAEEQTVLQHADTFRANGFDFEEVPDAGAMPRLRLTAVPFSKNTTFGVADVQELLALLEGGAAAAPSQAPAGPFGSLEDGVVRPSRVRAMLAMRACRCSIMIGRALDTQQMERVLQHLSELRAPWNCPHGRPTMRHLADLRHALVS